MGHPVVGKKTALGPPPPRFTLVMKIQNTKIQVQFKKFKYNYKKYKYNYKNRKKQGMISVLGSKKAALGPPGCTLVIKGTRVWLRNTLLSKSCSQEYKYTKIQIQIQLSSKQHVHKNTKISVKTMQSGRRKGASIICIIGGNEIDEKTFGSVFLLCICGLQKRKTVSEKATRAARQRPQFVFLCERLEMFWNK